MEPGKSAVNTALKYAILTALAVFIFSIVSYLTGFYLNSAAVWVSVVILIGGIVLAIKERRDKDLGGYISYNQAFFTGFLTSLFMSLFSAVLGFIMAQFLATDMTDNVLQKTEQSLVEKGLSDDQIAYALNLTRKFMTPTWQAIGSIVIFSLAGTIISLIVAAIFKKEDQQLKQPQ